MIKIKSFKNAIRIKCSPIIPGDFKYKMINRLTAVYLLKSDDRVIDFIKKPEISEEDTKDLMQFYEQNDFEYSFDELVELSLFPIGSFELFSKEGEKIAFFDLMPDGDVDSIWIDVFIKKYHQELLDFVNDISD